MPVPNTKITRSYSQEEIQQILQLAIARQSYEGEFTHEQLLEIAAELEISPATLQAAEQDWLAQQGELQQRQAFNHYRRSRLKKRVGNFAIFNTFFILLNLVGSGGLTWSLYLLLVTGLGLVLTTWNTYQSNGEEYERAFQQWYRKHQLRESISGIFNKLLKAW